MPARPFHTKRVQRALLELTNYVRAAIADYEDATDAQLIAIVSKRCGKKITRAQLKRIFKECSKLP